VQARFPEVLEHPTVEHFQITTTLETCYLALRKIVLCHRHWSLRAMRRHLNFVNRGQHSSSMNFCLSSSATFKGVFWNLTKLQVHALYQTQTTCLLKKMAQMVTAIFKLLGPQYLLS
jgi:hypothetical protein